MSNIIHATYEFEPPGVFACVHECEIACLNYKKQLCEQNME